MLAVQDGRKRGPVRTESPEPSPEEMQAAQRVSWASAQAFGWSDTYEWPDGTIGPDQAARFLDVTPEEYATAARASRAVAAQAARTARNAGQDGDPVWKARHAAAMAYVTAYAGTWGFVLSLRADPRWGTKWFRMTERQVEVIERAIERDRVNAKTRVQTGRDLSVLPIGTTRAAVENESGVLTFLVIDRPPDTMYGQPNKWAGWAFVKHQTGPNLSRLGSQRPGESYVGQWPSLIDKVIADPEAAVIRYGQALGICGICGRDLTNEASREEGIGPVCRARLNAG